MQPADTVLRSGARITNARGIPGTLGCLAVTLNDRRLVLLSSHHVLFGDNAAEQQPVRLAGDKTSTLVARSRHGKWGDLRYGDADVHVDCATAELVEQAPPKGWHVQDDQPGDDVAIIAGKRVSKLGAGTGLTHGVIADPNYTERARVDGRVRSTRGQILVEPLEPGERFTGVGDSGAALCDESGAVLGLLWGADARGYGLVCPIAPVLHVLHIRLVRFVKEGTS